MFVWSIPPLALRRLWLRGPGTGFPQQLAKSLRWPAATDLKSCALPSVGDRSAGLRISRVMVAGVRSQRRASFSALICQANLPGQKSQCRVARLVRLRVATWRLAAGAAGTLDQLRYRSARSDSGLIGCEYACSRFHIGFRFRMASLQQRRQRGNVRRSLRIRPSPAQRGAQLPHAQHRRKACRCSVSGAGTAPEAGGLGQGVSSNDNTMPGFSTARLSRPLLVSSVVTVTP